MQPNLRQTTRTRPQGNLPLNCLGCGIRFSSKPTSPNTVPLSSLPQEKAVAQSWSHTLWLQNSLPISLCPVRSPASPAHGSTPLHSSAQLVPLRWAYPCPSPAPKPALQPGFGHTNLRSDGQSLLLTLLLPFVLTLTSSQLLPSALSGSKLPTCTFPLYPFSASTVPAQMSCRQIHTNLTSKLQEHKLKWA